MAQVGRGNCGYQENKNSLNKKYKTTFSITDHVNPKQDDTGESLLGIVHAAYSSAEFTPILHKMDR